MSVNERKSIRQWQVIAEELSREFDSGKIVQLTIELDKALRETFGVCGVKRGRHFNPPKDDQAERDE